jgi:hypothetical protein
MRRESKETPLVSAIWEAMGVIKSLPEGCGCAFAISSDCDRANPAEVEVFPRDMEEYDAIRAKWKLEPVRVPVEVQWQRDIVRVVIYVPNAWEG